MKKLLLAASAMFLMAASFAQTAEEIVAKHIDAVGGKDKIEKIQNLVMVGSLTVQGASVSVTTTAVQGKLQRQDISVMGMANFVLMTDKEGWTYMPIQGQQKPEPSTPEDVKESLPDLDLFPLYNYAAKGSKIESLGKEDVEGTECFKLKVTFSTGKDETIFIDPTSYMIVREKTKKKANGQEMEITTDLSDYKDVEGVKLPFSIGAQFGTLIITSIKANQTIDEKIYSHEVAK